MACKINYIEQVYRSYNPELADKLNDTHVAILQEAVDSGLFKTRNNKLHFSSLGTKKLKLQEQFVIDKNNQLGGEVLSKTENNTLSVNVLNTIQQEPIMLDSRFSLKSKDTYNFYYKDWVYQKSDFEPPVRKSIKENPELETKLKSFMNIMGFEANVIDNYKKHLEVNGQEFTVNGFVDMLKKSVTSSPEALGEEVSHIASLLFVKDISTILEQVVGTDMYKKVKETYGKIYKDETKVRYETLGKLIHEAVINKNEDVVDGRLLTRLKRIWDRFINWVKGDKLQNFLDEISTAILEGDVTKFDAGRKVDGVYYQVDDNKMKFDSKEEELLYKAISSMKQRLNGLKENVGKGIGQNLREKIDILEQELEQKQAEVGLIKVLEFFNEDSRKVVEYINGVTDKSTLDSDTIKYMGHFMEYYFPILGDIRKAMNLGQIDKSKMDVVKESINRFEFINDFYEDVATLEAERKVGKIDEVVNYDVNMATYLFGSLRDVNDQILRKVHAIVSRILQEVKNVTYDIGKDLVAKFEGNYNTEKFREKVNGKKTHYFLNRHKLQEFYESYNSFMDDLFKEYGITRGVPIDRQKRIEFNRKKNKWLSENVERKFSPEYYEMFNELSLDTILAKETYDLQIRDILLSVTNSSNQIEFDKLSDGQFAQLEQLEAERKQLANLYDFEGEKKVGTDLQIAIELKALYEKMKGKLESVKLSDKFKEILRVKQQAVLSGTMTQATYDKWFKRVTQVEYSKEFYDELTALEKADYGQVYQALQEEKNELLKPYRNSELKVNTDLVPTVIQEKLFDIETQMAAIRKANKSNKKSDFDKIASIVTIKEYHIAKAKAKKDGTFEEWQKKNHIDGKPVSMWQQMIPKKKEHILTVPKRYWAETSEDSPLYNKNFNPDYKGMQPKDKWINPEYDKLTTKEKEQLDELLRIKNEGDVIYKNSVNSYYLLPQVSKTKVDVATSANRWSNFKELMSEAFVDKVQDDQFGEIETRADGSQIKYIPKKYVNKLDNPDFISDDLIKTVLLYRSSAERFRQMSKNASSLDIILEQIGKRRFVGKKKALSGKETNAYKVLQGFIDHHLYSIAQEPMGHFRLFGKEINTSKLLSNLEKYVRNKNLVFNLATTVTGYTTAAINTKIEDMVGTYTDQSSKLFAEKEYMRNAIQMLAETGKAEKNNKLSLIMEKLGFVEDPFNDLDKSRLTRLTTDIPYASYGIVSHRIKTKLALAMMNHYKIKDGKLVRKKELIQNSLKEKGLNIPLEKPTPQQSKERKEQIKEVEKQIEQEWKSLPHIYDMFEVVGNKVVPTEQLNEVLVDLQLKIEFVANRIDGALSPTDKAAAHRHAFLQLLTTHRGWLFSGVSNRFKQKGMNEITGEYEVGYYREWFSFLKATVMRPNRLRMLKNMLAQWETLEDYQKAAVKRTIYEIGMAVGIGVIAAILNGMADEDDEYAFVSYIANRTLLEASVFPSIASGMWPVASIEAGALLNSPIAAANVLDNFADIVHILSDEEIERGTYEGMTKGERALIRMTPGLRGYFSSRDPESANTFLKYKSLKWMPSY